MRWLSFFFLFPLVLLSIDPISNGDSSVFERRSVLRYIEQGNQKLEEGNLPLAKEFYFKALVFDPTLAAAHYGLGEVYKRGGKKEEAVREFRSATIFAPGFMKAYNALGALLAQLGKQKEALQIYFKAIAVDPYFPKNESVTANSRKKEEVEKLIEIKNGLKGKKVYVYADGDLKLSLLYARYFPLLEKTEATILFEPPKGAKELFHASFPGIQIINWLELEESISADYKVPLSGLPLVFPNLPKEIALKAPEKEVQEYKELVTQEGLRIGVAGDVKGLPKEAALYSLQTMDNSSSEITPLIEQYDTLAELAGAIANLDEVWTTKPEMASLAASLGKKTKLFLVKPTWEWFAKKEGTLLYSSLTIEQM